MKRRQFLRTTALGAVGLSLPGASWPSGPPARWQVFGHPALLTLLGDARRVRDIGWAYRHAFPEENTPEALAAAITSSNGLFVDLDEASVRSRLDRQIRDDFTRGRTVRIDGWILSETEARQCALYSMLIA